MRDDFAHWEGCSTGALYSAGQPQCTNPLPNRAASVQSRQRREGHCTNPAPNVAASVQSRTMRTGRVVPQGVCTVPGIGGGGFAHWEGRSTGTLHSAGRNQCTNPHPNRVASVQSRQRRKAQCANPLRTRLAPYAPASVFLVSSGLSNMPPLSSQLNQGYRVILGFQSV